MVSLEGRRCALSRDDRRLPRRRCWTLLTGCLSIPHGRSDLFVSGARTRKRLQIGGPWRGLRITSSLGTRPGCASQTAMLCMNLVSPFVWSGPQVDRSIPDIRPQGRGHRFGCLGKTWDHGLVALDRPWGHGACQPAVRNASHRDDDRRTPGTCGTGLPTRCRVVRRSTTAGLAHDSTPVCPRALA